MNKLDDADNKDIVLGVKWLITFRAAFAIVLFFSTFVFCAGDNLPFTVQPFLSLYTVSIVLFLFSIVSVILLLRFQPGIFFAYFQFAADSFFVTAIIFITGGFSSIFTFLYLIVIVGASIVLLQRGSMVIAAVCAVQYGVLVDLQYYGIIIPFGRHGVLASSTEWYHIVYRIVIIMTACFAVSFLSGLLAAEAKRARRDFKVMEGHLKRVERMLVIDELAFSMAHEIRNPLASLSGSIQLLKENTRPGSSNDRLMQIVLRETARLSRITSDFLVFAKPKAGKTINFRLDKATSEIVELFKKDPVCLGRIQIKDRIYHPVWTAMDHDHFNQIMWNLLKNAAESIENKGVIRIMLDRPRGKHVHLKISDNGCGIKKEDLNLVFNPFFTTKTNGTGLGLSIVHKMVDSYHGMIDLETMQGKGTVFTLILKTVQP